MTKARSKRRVLPLIFIVKCYLVVLNTPIQHKRWLSDVQNWLGVQVVIWTGRWIQ